MERQGNARQGKDVYSGMYLNGYIPVETPPGEAWQGEDGHGEARRCEATQGKARQL